MKITLFNKFLPFLVSAVFYSTSALAMSSSPENTDNYTPANWADSESAANDAKNAIENNDLRLLGFAGKSNSIPGTRYTDSQQYADKCGVRYFEEFGDVIKNNDQLREMKQARDYALEYNTVILEACAPE